MKTNNTCVISNNTGICIVANMWFMMKKMNLSINKYKHVCQKQQADTSLYVPNDFVIDQPR